MKFSFLIINFNHKEDVLNAINSALAQTYEDIEVICVDDCSTDGSYEYIKENVKDDRFTLISHEKNSSALTARMTAAEAATGDYCFFIDSDDSIKPFAAERVAGILKEKEYDLVNFNMDVMAGPDVTPKEIKDLYEFIGPFDGELTGSDYFKRVYINRTTAFTLHIKCYKTSVLKEACARAKHEYSNYAEDYYFFFVVASLLESVFGTSEMLSNYAYGEGISTASTYTLGKVNRIIDSAAVAMNACFDYINEYGIAPEYEKTVTGYQVDLIYGLLNLIHKCDESDYGAAYAHLMEQFGKNKVIDACIRTRDANKNYIYNHIDVKKLFPLDKKEIKTIALYYNRAYNGGVERVLSRLSFFYTAAGYNVVLITAEAENEDDYPFPETMKRVVLGCENEINDTDELVEHFEQFENIIRENNVDCVIYNAWLVPQLYWDMLASRAGGAYFIVHSHSTYCVGVEAPIPDLLFAQYNYKQADAIICLSDADRVFWSTINSNVFTVNNPLSFEIDEIKQSDQSKHNIIWSGRLDDPNKNVKDALEIFQIVQESIPDAHITFCGNAGEVFQKELDRLCDKYEIKDGVTFTGFTQDVASYLSESSVLLFTSNFEGYPMTIAEAFSAGLPVVAYSLPYLTLFKRKDLVMQVPRFDVDAAAEVIIDLFLHDDKRKELGQAAREYAVELSNIDHPGNWKKIFDTVVLQQETTVITPEAIDDFIKTSIHLMKHSIIEGGGGSGRSITSRIRFLDEVGTERAAVIEHLQKHIDEIHASPAYKIGNAIMWLPKKIKHSILHK